MSESEPLPLHYSVAIIGTVGELAAWLRALMHVCPEARVQLRRYTPHLRDPERITEWQFAMDDVNFEELAADVAARAREDRARKNRSHYVAWAGHFWAGHGLSPIGAAGLESLVSPR